MTVTKETFARYIDHSLLKPQLSFAEITAGVNYAKEINCKTVCVNPSSVTLAAKILEGTNTGVCSVVGFPLGTHTPYMKAKETEEAYRGGATEIDTVINIGALKSKAYDLVKEDIAAVVNAGTGIVKVILEMYYLTEEEKVIACQLTEEAGAHFVKTSTGFAAGGTTIEDILLMRRSVGKDIKVKAAGGIRDLKFALQLIEAGVDRIGISSTKAIMGEFDQT